MITNIEETHIYRASIKETLFFFLFYAFLVVIRYKTNNIVSQIFFLIPLVAFLFSKKVYFWLAFFFLLLESPGYLLHNFDTNYSLPQYLSFGERGIYFHELIVLATIIKCFLITEKDKITLSLRTPYIVIIIYIIFLFVLSFAYSIETFKIFRILRFLFVYSLIYTLPILLTKKEDYFNLFSLIFTIVYLVLFIQFLEFYLGVPSMANLLGGNPFIIDEVDYSTVQDRMSRPLYAPYVIELACIGAIFFLSYKIKIFNESYLYVSIAISFVAIFMSATRGLMLTLLTTVTGYLIFVHNKLRALSAIIIILLLAMIVLITLSKIPLIKYQIESSFERLSTIQYILQGDPSAGGTLGRLTERAPRVYNQFLESPMVGFGFSDIFWQYADHHVGHHTMLLNGGIVGYSIFIFFCIYFISTVLRTRSIISDNNPYKSSLLVLLIGFASLLVHHSTSGMIFSFIITWPYNGWFFLVALFLSFSDFVIKDALREEINLNQWHETQRLP